MVTMMPAPVQADPVPGMVALVWLAHTQFLHWQGKFSPLWINRIQRIFALLMVVILILRIHSGMSLVPEENKLHHATCPMCSPESTE